MYKDSYLLYVKIGALSLSNWNICHLFFPWFTDSIFYYEDEFLQWNGCQGKYFFTC